MCGVPKLLYLSSAEVGIDAAAGRPRLRAIVTAKLTTAVCMLLYIPTESVSNICLREEKLGQTFETLFDNGECCLPVSSLMSATPAHQHPSMMMHALPERFHFVRSLSLWFFSIAETPRLQPTQVTKSLAEPLVCATWRADCRVPHTATPYNGCLRYTPCTHIIHTMALRIAEAIAGLAVAATVVLSAVTPMAAATTTTAAPAPAQAAAPAQAQARATPQRQRRSPPASAAARSRNPVLAWGRWDQERSQDPVAPRIEGVANSNALVLGSESGQAAAAVDGSQEQPLDRSWTHAAFRAFHEMRAGSPPAASAGNGIDQESQGEKAGRGGGKDPLVGFRRLASRKQRRETNANDSATVAREEDEEEGEQRGKTRPPPPAACWHMRGRLTNTATGQTIALVEGVELARSLAFETAPSRKAAAADKRQKKLRNSKVAVGDNTRLPAAAATAPVGGEGELEVDKALKPGLWTAFGALACSKFFMYQARTTCSRLCTTI